jgi:hypothetical protein
MYLRTKNISNFLLWRVWHHCNNIVHGEGKASIVASASFIHNYDQSFLLASKPILPGHAGSEDSRRWVAPMEGRVMDNVDVVWDNLSNNTGIGIIIRDHMGQPVITEW